MSVGLGVCLSILCSIQAEANTAVAPGPERPNIVVILADDLGWEDVTSNGSRIKTPRIDSLADAGVRLQQLYVLPQCTPTRAALLTGRFAFRTGLQDWSIQPWTTKGLPLEERTIAQDLSDAGYETALVGKWHLGHGEEALLPHRRGFEHTYGCYGDGVDYFTHMRTTTLDWHRNGKSVVETGYATDLLATEAVRRIKERDTERPLFLYVPFTAPHAPNQSPQPVENEDDIFPAMVESLDLAVGRIIDALEAEQLSENTLLWFLSDNGRASKHKVRKGGIKGAKFQPYEGGIRSVSSVVWPGRIPAGSQCNQVLHAVDLLPTLTKLAGTTARDESLTLDGLDVWGALIGKDQIEREDLPLVISSQWSALRRGDWKLVLRLKDTVPEFELYHIGNDPRELHDLSDSRPKMLARLQRRLAHWKSQAVAPLQVRRLKPEGWEFPKVMGPEEHQ